LDDMPKTVMSSTEAERRPQASASEKRSTLWIVLGSSALLVLLFVLALVGAFDGAQSAGPIMFTSRPQGAIIYLDGIRLAEGKTPLMLTRQVAIGVHKVKYQLDGHEPAEGNLQVSAGAPTTFDLELRQVAIVPSPTPQPDEHTEDPKPPPVAKDPVHTVAAKAPGSVSVKSRVILKIYEGKTLLGVTPLQKPLSAGRHTLRAVHDLSGWAESRTVEINPGETARLDFSSGSGYLRINIQPSANVKIGNYVAETPMAPLELPTGSYTVKIWNSELGKQESTQVRITDGKETMLERNWRK
jgi:hypothetical protein